MIPKVILTEKGVQKEYPLVLKNAELVALEKETGIGVPIGIMSAIREGRIGVSYFADVIVLGISRVKRTTKPKVLEAMQEPVDEYMKPCLQAIFIAAGRPEVAKQLEEDMEADPETPDAPTEGGGESVNPTMTTAT